VRRSSAAAGAAMVEATRKTAASVAPVLAEPVVAPPPTTSIIPSTPVSDSISKIVAQGGNAPWSNLNDQQIEDVQRVLAVRGQEMDSIDLFTLDGMYKEMFDPKGIVHSEILGAKYGAAAAAFGRVLLTPPRSLAGVEVRVLANELFHHPVGTLEDEGIAGVL